MKKVIILTALILTIVAITGAFVACTANEVSPTITGFTIEVLDDYVFKVGDVFSYIGFKFEATLSDDSTLTPSSTNAGIVIDLSNLELDDKYQFTRAGDYVVKATYLNQYHAEVTITVEDE
ncbi:MAG: hypothetical protein LBF68_03495 [Christensenellaceae bacterium]|jgi:hypothetical protein|nr:hypothetical protein [Christensenellaceae bacterium]